MKKFLKDLETELRNKNLSDSEIEDIIADHREMIETAINEGLTDAELEKKFGNPKEVAEELSQSSDKKTNGRESKKMKTKEFKGIADNYNVTVALVSEDITFNHTDEDMIQVEYVGKKDLEDYVVEYENNEFVLKAPKKLNFDSGFFGKDERSFIITLPRNKKINKFSLKEVNGDIEVSDITAEEFEFGTKNGDVKFLNMNLDTFKINTINGDMIIENCECAVLSISQISGDLKLKNTIVKHDIDINTVSGDLEFNHVECIDFKMSTVSGDLDAKEFYPERLSLSSVSGDVSIKNTDATRPIEIKHKRTVSGDIDIKFSK